MDFRVILQESARKKLNYLGSLTVPNRQGRLIALGEAATFEVGPGRGLTG